MTTKKRGFTMLELLIAGAIIVSVFSSLALFLRGFSCTCTKADMSVTSTLAMTNELEHLRSMSFPEVSAILHGHFDSGNGEVVVKNIANGLLLIEVSHTSSDCQPTKRIYTMRSDL